MPLVVPWQPPAATATALHGNPTECHGNPNGTPKFTAPRLGLGLGLGFGLGLRCRAEVCTPAEAAVAVVAGKAEAVAEKAANVGGSTDEAIEAPTRMVVARPRLLTAMAATPKPLLAEVFQRASAIGVARRAIGRATARRSYAVDAEDGGALSRCLPHVRGSMQSMQRTGARC